MTPIYFYSFVIKSRR